MLCFFSTEILLESWCCTCLMWDFQLNLSSIITPINLFSLTLFISTPSICIWTCVHFLQLPNSIQLIWLMFNANLFLSNHLFNLLISKVIVSKTSFNLPQKKKKCNLRIKLIWLVLILCRYNLYKAKITLDPVLTPGDATSNAPAQRWIFPQLHKLFSVS